LCLKYFDRRNERNAATRSQRSACECRRPLDAEAR
jgi:hypothetical protein